jgi:chromosome segregation ATPase
MFEIDLIITFFAGVIIPTLTWAISRKKQLSEASSRLKEDYTSALQQLRAMTDEWQAAEKEIASMRSEVLLLKGEIKILLDELRRYRDKYGEL